MSSNSNFFLSNSYTIVSDFSVLTFFLFFLHEFDDLEAKMLPPLQVSFIVDVKNDKKKKV